MITILALVSLASVLAAAVAVTVAWRTVQTERRRSDARMAALMAGLSLDPPGAGTEGSDTDDRGDEGGGALSLDAPAATGRPFAWAVPSFEVPAATGGLFRAVPSSTGATASGVPRLAVFAIGGLLMIGVATALSLAVRGTTPAAVAAAPESLELVALEHARNGERLTISGLVRNPRQAPALDTVNAVVVFLDGAGRVIASERTPLDFRRLGPGDESPFTISVEAPADLGRYRVSFRHDAGGVVPHVDRRAGRATS